jgi:hypothetical protein
VLIDDARSFNGQRDFPTLEMLRRLVARLFPHHYFAVEDDIVSVLPRENPRTAHPPASPIR